ncbi:hypothetical protein [Haloterrigena salifodinae]|uniref:hypothetical protein n=1 Tax=Haloterrigena salifodinae TaxID=2675099 RepID=UPI000F868ABC|nr:hypothetical protein [Haloterrigena salifodinae]
MTEHRNLRRIYSEIIENPWLTLLFFSESAKKFVEQGYVVTPIVQDFLILTAVSLLLWVLSDAVSVDASREKLIGDGGRER